MYGQVGSPSCNLWVLWGSLSTSMISFFITSFASQVCDLFLFYGLICFIALNFLYQKDENSLYLVCAA